MGTATARRIWLLVAALATVGCRSDDDGPCLNMIDPARYEWTPDCGNIVTDPPGAFPPTPPFHLQIGLSELHGVSGVDRLGVASVALMPMLSIRATPRLLRDDIPTLTWGGDGCVVNTYDLELDPPSYDNELGRVTVTGFTGSGGGADHGELPGSLRCSPSASRPDEPYACEALPRLISEGSVVSRTPASILRTGDALRFDASGGVASEEAPVTLFSTSIPPPLDYDSPDLSLVDLEQPTGFTIDVNCSDDPTCGPYNVVALHYSDNPDPLGPPARWFGEVTCVSLFDDIEVDPTYLGYAAGSPWASVIIEVYRTGSNPFARDATFAAGVGTFVVRRR